MTGISLRPSFLTQRQIHQTEYPYHITTVTADRAPVFENSQFALIVHETIRTSCVLKGFDLIAHAINPDHIHLMVWKYKKSTNDGLITRVREPALGQNTIESTCRIFTQRAFSKARGDRTSADISHLMQSIKGTFSRFIHQGRLWQPRFFSRIVQSEDQFNSTLQYIALNHRKHQLPEQYSVSPYVYIAPEYYVPEEKVFTES